MTATVLQRAGDRLAGVDDFLRKRVDLAAGKTQINDAENRIKYPADRSVGASDSSGIHARPDTCYAVRAPTNNSLVRVVERFSNLPLAWARNHGKGTLRESVCLIELIEPRVKLPDTQVVGSSDYGGRTVHSLLKR